jgi:23S rRNA (adenine2503-C2)-methyltransferase
VPGLDFKSPSKTECKNFISYLEKAGLNCSLRVKRGSSIGGACGQLGRTVKQ